MASPPPSYTSAASVSRSKKDETRLIADAMLRSSLSRGVSSASSASTTPKPPVFTSSASISRSRTSQDDARAKADAMLRSSLTHSVSSAPQSPSSYHSATPALSPLPGRSHIRVVADSSSRVSAAEAKLRVSELQREADRINAELPQRATKGIFKKACSVDLLFLIDTTGSMWSYIEAAKKQVHSIVDDIKKTYLNESYVSVAVVGYKDHYDTPNVQFLDFTPTADEVRKFLSTLVASGGGDAPEDVLGGIQQALNASWKHQTRCLIHIADAPPHGRELHDLSEGGDNYIKAGSEPHRLKYEPLLSQLSELNINYCLLRINASTDRMALAFCRVYATASADVKLFPSNIYYSEVNGTSAKVGGASWSEAMAKVSPNAKLQFEELKLGVAYSELRRLIVGTVTSSVSRTVGRLSMALSSAGKGSGGGRKVSKMTTKLTAVREDDGTDREAGDICLEKGKPQWTTPGWLDEKLAVEGYCPDVAVHSATTLNDMMAADENIKLSVVQLSMSMRSKPFAQGALRLASYARTAASTSRFVVKSFKEDGKELAHLAEDMRIQALCKAFALEFNGLLKKEEHSIDFIATTCLEGKLGTASVKGCLSLEPFIEGEYEKYNSNGAWVKPDSSGDLFNQTAQAFSHFTFERSWGHLLVNDLQGVGHLLTDPAIQTSDPERFKLNDTNLNEEGFKFFFALHECNHICRKLGLKSNREMLISGKYEFRKRWPTMDATVCCSNKLCRRIVRLADTHEMDKFPGHRWCKLCWPQLQSSIERWICVAPGPNHEFDASRFFHESQGRLPPRRCPEHLERDTTVSSIEVVGGSLWNRMKATDSRRSISGSSW